MQSKCDGDPLGSSFFARKHGGYPDLSAGRFHSANGPIPGIWRGRPGEHRFVGSWQDLPFDMRLANGGYVPHAAA